MLKYYQWSPFILLFMALCFYFPRMLWRSLNHRSGLDIEKLVNAAMKQEQQDNQREEREKTIDYIVDSIRMYVENRYSSSPHFNHRPKSPAKKFWYWITFWRHRHLGAYIFILFTFVKALFLLNSVVQIVLLNAFLGNEYHLFGFEVIGKFLRGLDWGESKRFPRVTLCDFHIREVGIVHRYTVQCVLPINLFNEKIFLVLWFWILLLAAFNAGDFISWIIRIMSVESRSAYVRRKLAMSGAMKLSDDDDDSPGSEQERFDRKNQGKAFVRNYLQEDGCFALRLLARNGQDIIVGDVIDKLFTHFCSIYQREHTNTDRAIHPSTDPQRHYGRSSSYHSAMPRTPPSPPMEVSTQHEDQRPLVTRLTA
jgi:innexin